MKWFEEAFCHHYLEVYSHRTEEQAFAEIAFAHEHLHFAKDQIVLDLCCGAGRHAFALSPLVKSVVGFDLSSDLLNYATKENLSKKCDNIFWQKGDMRNINFLNSFDAVVCFFNSFGYFENENENNQVITNVYNALKPQGYLLIDLMNKPFIVKNLKEQTIKTINQYKIVETRIISSDGLRVKKEVKIFESDTLIKDYLESVRMYNVEDISGIIKKAGFKSLKIFGDLNNAPLTADSPRMILIAQKP